MMDQKKGTAQASVAASAVASVSIADQVRIPSYIQYTEDDLQHIIILNVDTGDLWGLDDSSVVIWRALAESQSIQAAIDAVVTTYNIDADSATTDVLIFVKELVDNGCLFVDHTA